MQIEEQPILEENGKKIRRRKKNLYNSILQQMEFYFSDANLRKDRFIGQHIKNNPYVELSVFLNFNKISALTNNVEEIATALEKSQLLQLSEDKLKVCRTTPVKAKDNEDECTIYVERLPDDTQHDWLKEIFSTFGSIDYVSLPKYKHNKRHKGFAFIEFSDAKSAQKAISYFDSIGYKLPTQMPPNQLVSIITFEPENGIINKIESEKQPVSKNNENVSENIQDIEDNKEVNIKMEEETNVEHSVNKIKKKKRKLSPDNDESDVKKCKVEFTEVEVIKTVIADADVTQDENEGKKKRKRKKNKKNIYDFKQIGLQVLSKREWKQLRNKYLNMQRIKMKSLKEHLYRNRNINDHSDNTAEETTKNECTTESEPRFKFVPGCIMRFIIPEACNDVKKLKNDIRQHTGVEFVDIHPGKQIGFIRFSDTSFTEVFVESSSLNSMHVLEGEEEKEYWDKIIKDRETKLKKGPGKKVRGREKLLKKAEQELGKHIRFESI